MPLARIRRIPPRRPRFHIQFTEIAVHELGSDSDEPVIHVKGPEAVEAYLLGAQVMAAAKAAQDGAVVVKRAIGDAGGSIT